jgi:UDP-glucose 4-epimerase
VRVTFPFAGAVAGVPEVMRIVVTGATGNVGTSVLRALRRGDHQVVGLARRTPQRFDPPYDVAAWRSIDLTRDDEVPRLREAVRGADAVVHLAWGFQPARRPDQLEALGVDGTRRVAEAVVAEGVPHLVHMSSAGAYSPRENDEPVDESWPTGGIPTSTYSRHKAAAERLLDGIEESHPELTVTRLRPGLVAQAMAGSALLRYGVPALVPASLIRFLPLLPLDRRLSVPVVHSDDVATAVMAALEQRAAGPFNLAAGRPVTVGHAAAALHAKPVHVPARLVRGAAAAAWYARLDAVEPGWLDMAYAVPVLDTSRAGRELGWQPFHSEVEVLDEAVAGLTRAASAPTPVLRRRNPLAALAQAIGDAPVSRRREP